MAGINFDPNKIYSDSTKKQGINFDPDKIYGGGNPDPSKVIMNTDVNNDGRVGIKDLVRAKKMTAQSGVDGNAVIMSANQKSTDEIKKYLTSNKFGYDSAVNSAIEKLEKNQLSDDDKKLFIETLEKAQVDDKLTEEEREYYSKLLNGYRYSGSTSYEDLRFNNDYEKVLKDAVRVTNGGKLNDTSKSLTPTASDIVKYGVNNNGNKPTEIKQSPKIDVDFETLKHHALRSLDDELYFYELTGHSKAEYLNNYDGYTDSAKADTRIKELNADEAAMLIYISETKGQKEAWNYLTELRDDLGSRKQLKAVKEMKDTYERSSTWGKINLNAYSVLSNVYKSPLSFFDMAKQYAVKGEFDAYTDFQISTAADSQIRQSTAEEIKNEVDIPTLKNIASHTYQAFMSGVDMYVGSMTLGAIGKYGYTSSMTLGAGAGKARDLYARGASQEQIAWGAVATAAIEFLIERGVGDNIENVTTQAGVKEFLKQVNAEGIEEVFSELGDMVVESLVMGKNSASATEVRRLMQEEGLSEVEAWLRVTKEKTTDIFWSYYGGAISAGTMRIPATVSYSMTNHSYGNKIQNNHNKQNLIDIALTLPEDSEAYKLAKGISDKGGNASTSRVGELFRATANYVSNIEGTTMLEAVEKELKRYHVTDASDVAETIVAMAQMKDVDPKVRNEIFSNNITNRIYTQLIGEMTDTLGQGGIARSNASRGAATWVVDLGIKRANYLSASILVNELLNSETKSPIGTTDYQSAAEGFSQLINEGDLLNNKTNQNGITLPKKQSLRALPKKRLLQSSANGGIISDGGDSDVNGETADTSIEEGKNFGGKRKVSQSNAAIDGYVAGGKAEILSQTPEDGRRRIKVNYKKSNVTFVEGKPEDTSGRRAYIAFCNAGINAIYCDGEIIRNVDGKDIVRTDAFTAPDGTVYISSLCEFTDKEIYDHERVHVADFSNNPIYIEYYDTLNFVVDLFSDKYIELADNINREQFTKEIIKDPKTGKIIEKIGKYDINNPDTVPIFIREIAAYVNQYVLSDLEKAERIFGGMFKDWGTVVDAVNKFNTDMGADFSESASFMHRNEENGQSGTPAPTGNVVPIEGYGERHRLSKAEQDYIEEICKALGRKVVFEHISETAKKLGIDTSKGIPDGYYENGVIHLGFVTVDPIRFIFKHELTHFTEGTIQYDKFVKAIKKSKALKKWLQDVLKAKTNDIDILIESYTEKIKPQYKVGTDLEAEMYADFVGEILFNEDGSGLEGLLSGLDYKERNVVAQFIRDFFKWLIEKLGGNTNLSFEIRRLEYNFNRALSEATATKKIPTESGEVRYDINTVKITESNIEKNISDIVKMNPVSVMSGNEFSKGEKDLVTQVDDYFAKFGYSAHNSVLGDVDITARGAKDSIAHGIGRNKAVAFAAVPDIIKSGKIIDYQTNWKNRGYDTVVLAAPVTINNTQYYEGVIVIRDSKTQRFYVHEVITEKRTDMSFKTGADSKVGKSGDISSPSIISLLDKIRVVKENLTNQQADNNNSMSEIEKDTSNIKFSFARVYDTAQIKAAEKTEQEMKADNKSEDEIRRAIWQEHKIIRDTGGIWVYEIDDSEMRFHLYGDAQMKHTGELKEFYDLAKLKRKTKEKRKRYFELQEKYGSVYFQKGKLVDYVKHDVLFEKYPQLKDVNIEFKLLGTADGEYNHKTNTIFLNSMLFMANDELKGIDRKMDELSRKLYIDNVIIHEIQHALQYYDERESGSNIKVWSNRLLRGERLPINPQTGEELTPEEAYYYTHGEYEAREAGGRKTWDKEEREEEMPDLGWGKTISVKEAYASSEVKFSIPQGGIDSSIKQQLNGHSKELNSLGVVFNQTFTAEFDSKQAAVEWVVSKLKSNESNVERKGFGEIVFDKKRIKSGIRYAKTKEEIYAFTAVPQVLRRGIEIATHSNHKGRIYDTVTFAAPIVINGKRGNMAVVVRLDDKNYYKVHRVLMPDGSQFLLDEKGDTVERAGGVEINSSLSPTNSVSNDSIPKNIDNVNKYYTAAVENGDTETAQELVDEAARAAGYTERLYHQTGAEFTEFNTKNQKAGKFDYELPTGTFLKPTDTDIGLSGKKQMGLYAKFQNPLHFDDRKEAKAYWSENVPEYKQAVKELNKLNAEYRQRVDEAEADVQDYINEWRRNNPDASRREVYNDPQFQKLYDVQQDITEEWDKSEGEVSVKAKSIIDGFIKESGYDGIIIERDDDGKNHYTKSYIAFSSAQLKSADAVTYDDNGEVIPLSERFNVENEDIRYAMPNELLTLSRAYKKGEISEEAYDTRVEEIWTETLAKWKEDGNNKLAEKLEKAREKNKKYSQKLSSKNQQLKRKNEQLKAQNAELKRYNEEVTPYGTVSFGENLRQTKQTLSRIKTRFDTNSDKKHIPEELKEYTDRLLTAFNRDDPMPFNKESIELMASAYGDFAGGDDKAEQVGYDPEIKELLSNLAGAVDGKTVKELNFVELYSIREVTDNLWHMIQGDIEMFLEGKKEKVAQVGNRMFSALSDKKDKAERYGTKTWESVKYNNMLAIYYFEEMGEPFKPILETLMDNEDTCSRNDENNKAFLNKTQNRYNYKNWKDNVLREITLKNGVKLKLTVEQALYLYSAHKREKHLQRNETEHLFGGGITVPEQTKGFFGAVKEIKENLKTSNKKGFRKLYDTTLKELNGNAISITEQDIDSVIGQLTEQQKAYADEIVGYLSNDMAALGNQASMLMFGYCKYNETYYIPFVTAKDYLFRKFIPTDGNNASIKHSSFTHNLIRKAKVPLVIDSFTDIACDHMAKMSRYNASAATMDALTKILNYSDGGNSTVRTEIKRVYGKGALDYLDTFMTDMNGGNNSPEKSDELFNKLIGLYKKSAVSASVSVAVQQPMSIIRAFVEIDPKYFVGKVSKADYREMLKYCPVAAVKEKGRVDIGTSSTTVEWMKSQSPEGMGEAVKAFVKDKNYRDDKWMTLATKGDQIAWTLIYRAVKREIVHTTDLKVDSPEFFEAVNKRFRYIVNKTQVYDSPFSRSQIMRSKSVVTKMLTSFMAEPTVWANALYGYGKRHPVKVVAAFVVSGVLTAAVKSSPTAGRDDDEEKTWGEKYKEAFKASLWDNVNPLNLVPVVKDVVSLCQGWDIERMDMALISDVVTAWRALGSDNKSTWRKIEDFAGALSSFCGIPTKNIMRDIRATYTTVTDLLINDKPKRAVNNEVDEYLELFKDNETYGEFSDEDKDKLEKNMTEKVRMVQAAQGDKKALDDFDELYSLMRKNNKKYSEKRKELIREGKYTPNEITNGIEVARIAYMKSQGIDVNEYLLYKIALARKELDSDFKAADTDKDGTVDSKEKLKAIDNLDLSSQAKRFFKKGYK